MSRYARQICLPEIGTDGQARLAAARVLVVGAGGLGSALLPLLVGAGVGQITLCDPDVVEVHNLHRQTLFRMSDLGQPKAQIAADALIGLNPDVTLEAHVARLTPANLPHWSRDVDLIVDAADSFATSYALSDHCHHTGQPLISASVTGRQGYVGGFCGGAPSLRAVFPDLPDVMGSCATSGVMGPAVATLAAMQAQMALSVLLGHAPSPLGRLLSVDFATWRVSQFDFEDAPEPSGFFPKIISSREIEKDDLVVDLRAEETIDPVQHSPSPERRVVFLCASGLRAWRAARDLADKGHRRVVICAVGA